MVPGAPEELPRRYVPGSRAGAEPGTSALTKQHLSNAQLDERNTVGKQVPTPPDQPLLAGREQFRGVERVPLSTKMPL